MRKAALILVCTMIIFTGCSGSLVEPGATDSTSSLTDADNDATSPEPPVGVNSNGVYDSQILVSNHSRFLSERPYSINTTNVERYHNGTLRTQEEMVTKYTKGRAALRFSYTVNGTVSKVLGSPDGHIEAWSNKSTEFMQIEVGNSTRYERKTPEIAPTDYSGSLYHLLSLVNLSVEERSTFESSTVFQLQSTNVSRPNDIPSKTGVTDVRNVSMTVTVDPRGFVRSFTVSSDYEYRNQSIHKIMEVRFEVDDSNTVRKPPWISAASKETHMA